MDYFKDSMNPDPSVAFGYCHALGEIIMSLYTHDIMILAVIGQVILR